MVLVINLVSFQKPALDLVSALELGNAENALEPIWWPVIEPDFGQVRFMPEDPVEILSRVDFSKVPVMAGITSDEFIELIPCMY